MFCPNCGQTVSKKLKYCNSCGERLSKSAEIDKEGMPGKMLDNVLTTLFLVVMFGLGILVGLVAVLLGSNVAVESVVIIVGFYLASVFGISFMLARQATKLIDHRLKTRDDDAGYSRLAAAEPPKLVEFREPIGSVTDRTTRTLVDVERKD